MTSLTDYCQTFRLCPIKVMNLLQDYGLVSDNCISTDDVAPCDVDLAMRFCKLNSRDLHAQQNALPG